MIQLSQRSDPSGERRAAERPRALRTLVASGPMRIGDLASMLEIVPRTATTRVDGLEQAGLVARSADPTDRRSVVVSATEQGQELVARLTEERRASAETMFAPLSPADQSALLRVLGLLAGDSKEV